jgi:hypothetical protein
MNEKKNNSIRIKKSLTVEDLAQVVGGTEDGGGEEGTLKYGGETKGKQRESRFPPVAGDIGDIGGVFQP